MVFARSAIRSRKQSLGDFAALSAALSCALIEISKIANALRLLNSGPHTSLNEIELPALQPGSSIMPDKVNPAVAEMNEHGQFPRDGPSLGDHASG